MTISIVIPAYNAEKYLSFTLDSVLAQTVTDWELIIVNDGSQDSTDQIARDYAARDPRIRFVSQPNAGVSAARNYGYSLTNPETPYITFLDADDVWEADALATLQAALEPHPEASAAYGLARYIGSAGELIEPGVCEGHQQFRVGVENSRVVVWPPDRPTTFAVEAVMERVMTPGTVLIRRAAVRQAGLFDTSLRIWEDWDFWLRLSRVGVMIFVNTLVLGYRRHETNVSSEEEAVEAANWYVRRQLLDSLHDDPENLSIACIGLAYRHRCDGSNRLRRLPSLCRERQIGRAAQEFFCAVKDYSASLSSTRKAKALHFRRAHPPFRKTS